MKKFTLFILITFIASVVTAQTTFNWVEESISPDNNLQEMHLYEDQSAVIVGHSCTFAKYDPVDKNWNAIKVATPIYNFVSMSIDNGVGLLSSRRGKMINNPSGGNPDIYANGLCLKTTDNGASWTDFDLSGLADIPIDTLNPLSEGSLAMDIFAVEFIDENNILLYSGWYDYRPGEPEEKENRGAVFATTDGGVSWDPITGDLGSSIITSICNNGSYNVIGGNNFIRKHVTGTTTTEDLYDAFTAVAGTDNFYVSNITIVDENTFYVVTTTDGLFKSTDGGASFIRIGEGTLGGGNDFYVHNADVMMVLGTSTKSFATIDGGATWVACYPGSTSYDIAGIFNGELYACAKSVVYKLTVADLEAGNYNWTSVEISYDNMLKKMYIADDNTAFIAGYGQAMQLTVDGGLTWTAVACPDVYLPIAEEIDFRPLVVSGDISIAAARRFKLINYPSSSEYTDLSVDGIILRSFDNWETWEVFDITLIGELESSDPSLNPTMDSCYGVDPFTMAFTNDSTIFVWIDWYEIIGPDEKITHARIFKSTDNGETWYSISIDFGSSYITDINFINENYGIVTGNKVLLKTTDAGESFTDLYPTLVVDPAADSTYYLKGVIMVTEDEFYVTTVSNGIFKTIDGGASFTMFEGVAGSNDFIKLDTSIYMALGSSSKSYYSNNGGVSWENCYPGSTIWTIGEVMNDSLYALAKGKVFKIAMTEIVPAFIVSQEIELFYGYEFISSRLIPENPDMLTICDGILDNLDFVRNSGGLMLRKIGPDWINGIGNWITTEGYLFRMNNSDQFTIEGTVIPQDTPIELFAGYQFVSYLPAYEMDAMDAFASIIGDNLIYVRNSDGYMLRKIGPNWVNGIGNCIPTEGYLIKMNGDDILIYPEAGEKLTGITNIEPDHFIFEGGNAADPVFTIYVEGLNIDDEVAAYDGDIMIGAMKVNSQNVFDNSLALFSTLTKGQGYVEGNPIILKVWSENNIVSADFTMEAMYDAYVSDVYPAEDGKYSIVNITKGTIENMEETFSVYPNPSKGIITIGNLSGFENLTSLKITDITGKIVFQSKIFNQKSSIEIDLSWAKKGVYFISFSGKDFSQVKKIVIQ